MAALATPRHISSVFDITESALLSRSEIELAYRLLLGRAADSGGLAHYESLGRQGLDLDGLRGHLVSSPEYRSNLDSAQQRIVDIGHARVVVDATEPEFGRHIAIHGNWEPHIMALIRRHLRPGDTYVDVGANVGVMAFTAAAAVGAGGRVLAFEPHPDNIRNFLAGVTVNGFDQVTLYGFALSDAQSIFSLVGTSNGYLMPGGQTVFQAVALPGDPILANQPRIDMLKMDIEGHEPHALAGLDRTLRRHRPIVLGEFNPRCLKDHIGCLPADFARQLFGLTDAIDAIEHDGRLNPVRSPTELTDLWERRNAEAVASNFLPDGMLHFDLVFRVN
jgi:FkbM family methyltransferase